MKLKVKALAALATVFISLVSCGVGQTQETPVSQTPQPSPLLLSPNQTGHSFLGKLTTTTAVGVGDLDCRDFVSQSEAQLYFNKSGGSVSNNVDGLDWNHNGFPCEVNEDWAVRTAYWTGTATVVAPPTTGMCWVNGYYRRDGTYVHGYWRRC